MKLVDSNVLIAYFNPRDRLYSRATALQLDDASINELVFSEIANVLENRVDDKKIVFDSLDQICRNIQILPVTAKIPDALGIFFKYFKKISFTDSVLLVEAKQSGSILVTFDQQLKTAAEAEGVEVEGF